MNSHRLLVLLSLVSGACFGQEVLHGAKLQDKVFPKTNECSIKRFSVASYDSALVNMFGMIGTSRGSTMAAVIETSSPDCLKNYGVVQYIRGCIYDGEYNSDTKTFGKHFGLVRDSRGESIRFQHKGWEVDSADVDPLYNSYEGDDANESNRQLWHRFAKKPLTLKADRRSLEVDEKTFFNKKNYEYVVNGDASKLSQIFVTDLPSGSEFYPQPGPVKSFRISSLEFKTCLYEMKDIPMTGDPVHEPMVCFSWSDKMAFNPEKKVLERTEKLDPFCEVF